jgi:hypothetical protein
MFSEELYSFPVYACTVIRWDPVVIARPGVVMDVTLLAVNFATLSTHTFMY